MPPILTLGQKQELFQRLRAEWVSWIFSHPGWAIRSGEGRILPLGTSGVYGRKARVVATGQIVLVRDLVHKENGTHYMGIGEDQSLWVNGKQLIFGTEPEWLLAGEKWESMHELCRWGGRFQDANHISITHNGVM
jgi:hypothetical protein